MKRKRKRRNKSENNETKAKPTKQKRKQWNESKLSISQQELASISPEKPHHYRTCVRFGTTK
jgi:hypothetical protein